MRSLLLGAILAAILTVPAFAQPRGGFGGGYGGGYGGRGGFMHRPGGFGGRPFVGRFRQRFSGANVTHDGHLTLDQARAADMNVIAKHFSSIDTGHKGYITLDDIRAYRQKVLERRRAAQGDEDVGGEGIGPPP